MAVDVLTTPDNLTDAKPNSSYSVSRKSNPNYIEGRRTFLKYTDLGVIDVSSGRVRAQLMSATEGLSEPTGWHYHVCDGQFVYMLNGWVDLAFRDGDIVRIEEGDSMYIPGGVPHNEIATSDGFELLEVSVPADMGTEVCDPPEGWTNEN